MALIRPYKSADMAQMAHICRATLLPSLESSEIATRLAPYVWTLQYTHLCPENCFVLDDGSGNAVGYVIGCPDVFAFTTVYPRYVSEVLRQGLGAREVPAPRQLERLEPWFLPRRPEAGSDSQAVNPECLAQLAYKPEWLLLQGAVGKSEMVGAYRATMHIDLLPHMQGRGWGRRMVETFADSVKLAVREGKATAGKGIHIGVGGENSKVVPFYERCEFRVYHGGESEGSIWMVKELDM